VTTTTVSLAQPSGQSRRLSRTSIAGWAWSGSLIALLAFLVLYPLSMPLYGTLSGANPVVDGFHLSAVSLGHFTAVLANPNVHFALANTFMVCSGGRRWRWPSASPSPGSWRAPTRRGKG
jgi:hypothetical protein